MKDFFKELFEYNQHINNQVIDLLSGNATKASTKCMELISHILNVHQIWNRKIQPDPVQYESWQVQPLQELSNINKQNTEQSMLIVDAFHLDQLIPYTTSKGHPFEHSVRDILFQIINHSTYHRAQIATEFRQAGIEPLLTDYIYYKMINSRQ